MNSTKLKIVPDLDIREWVNPDPDTLPEQKRSGYLKLRSALVAAIGGMSVRAAAKAYDVDRRALSKALKFAPSLGPDGRAVGFRACVPYRHRVSRLPERSKEPVRSGPGAFTRLMAATPGLPELVHGYSGPLPTGKYKCRKFNSLFGKVLNLSRRIHGAESYPFDVADSGRRALLEYIKRERHKRAEQQCPEAFPEEQPSHAMRVLFRDAPLDRIEYDAHTADIQLKLAIDAPDGSTVVRTLRNVTLLIAICAVSRHILSYVLRFGAYNQLDVLTLFHRALEPWTPRQLIVPGMSYPDGAVIGLANLLPERSPRGIMIAGDNALAHHADAVIGNLQVHHRGVLNLGKAYVPESRPIVEAFFRRIEEGGLRGIAGSFQPASTNTSGPVATTNMRPDHYPLHFQAFEDLMDVLVAGHSVTPHSGLHLNTPVDRLKTHLVQGGWHFESADSCSDATRLTTVRIRPTVRGSRRAGKPPYVEWGSSKYRSPRLDMDWSRIGTCLDADVNLEDIRTMVLLDPKGGGPLFKLHAMPPWDQSPHTLAMRRAILSARKRGLLEIEGASDAIEAYHNMVRSKAFKAGTHVTQLAQLEASGHAYRPQPVQPAPKTPAPRGGRFSFNKERG